MSNDSLRDIAFIVVDVETTGMDPVGDRITEIAMMKVRDGVLQDEFSTLVNPLVTIPANITRITGIDNAMVHDAPTAREIAPYVAEFLGTDVFVAHNVAFDWGFVRHTLRREGGIEILNPLLCTVKLSRRILPSLPSKSLDPVTRALNIRIPARHRASGDAYATALVLIKFLSFVQKAHDIETLDDLLAFQNSGSRIRRSNA
jgi:DNA polymerase III epsilon subunit family exonuclease